MRVLIGYVRAEDSNAATFEPYTNESRQALGELRNMTQETVYMCEEKTFNMRSFHLQEAFG